MKKEDIVYFRIQKVFEDQTDYEFPVFLRLLRRLHGMQRKFVCADIGISETRLFYLENGRFKRMPGLDELALLGDYYGVQRTLLAEKAKNFLKSGKSRRQGDPNG